MTKLCHLYQKVCLVILTMCAIIFALPLLFGYSCYAIESESMEPTLSKGMLIYVRPVKNNEFMLNDIITFEHLGNLYSHRVVGIDNNQHLLTTKGDGNRFNDGIKVSIGNIKGKVQFSIPWAGYLLIYMKTVEGIILGSLIVSLFIISIMISTIGDGDREDENN